MTRQEIQLPIEVAAALSAHAQGLQSIDARLKHPMFFTTMISMSRSLYLELLKSPTREKTNVIMLRSDNINRMWDQISGKLQNQESMDRHSLLAINHQPITIDGVVQPTLIMVFRTPNEIDPVKASSSGLLFDISSQKLSILNFEKPLYTPSVNV